MKIEVAEVDSIAFPTLNLCAKMWLSQKHPISQRVHSRHITGAEGKSNLRRVRSQVPLAWPALLDHFNLDVTSFRPKHHHKADDLLIPSVVLQTLKPRFC